MPTKFMSKFLLPRASKKSKEMRKTLARATRQPSKAQPMSYKNYNKNL
uniref:Uncharacterized protein n=1 Tax=Brassica oleracea TaxID=3712 RepID=A0A3P6DZE0_BRAOL|nr:unnamed protein product [Brassica oleracea]